MTNKIDPCDTIRVNLIAAAVGLQKCTKTESNIVPIPGGDHVIAIGKPAQVRALLADATSGSDGTAAAGAGTRAEFEQYCDYAIDGSDPISRDWLFDFCTHWLAQKANIKGTA